MDGAAGPVRRSFRFCADHISATPVGPPPAQAAAKDDPERQQAIEVFNAGKYVEAMPLLEKLAVDHPEDATIKANWAFSVAAYAATLTDLDLRKKARIRARAIALQAQKQGANTATLRLVLEIPEDGSAPAFSDRKDVDDAMKAAEADFVRGDLDQARTGYLHSLLLDPNNYVAALFTGDVYFKQHVYASAGELFARAVQIDPNRARPPTVTGETHSRLRERSPRLARSTSTQSSPSPTTRQRGAVSCSGRGRRKSL
jgi:tetratricopeptide (TPR) repeat protein